MAPCLRRQRPSPSLAASPGLLPLLIPTATGPICPAAAAPTAAASHGTHAAPLLGTGSTDTKTTQTHLERDCIYFLTCEKLFTNHEQIGMRKQGNVVNYAKPPILSSED